MTAVTVAVPFAAGPSWLSLGFMLPYVYAVDPARAGGVDRASSPRSCSEMVLASGQALKLGALRRPPEHAHRRRAGRSDHLRDTAERTAAHPRGTGQARHHRGAAAASPANSTTCSAHNLSVIAMRTELSMRIPADQLPGMHRELTEIHDIARRSLHDVRAVVKGYREMSLEKELGGVRKVLESAGVKCDFAALPASLSTEVRVALAWAVREAATNLLRHSDATVCLLDVEEEDDRIRVTVSNDGVRPERPSAAKAAEASVGGSGLAGLDERLAQVGGAATGTSKTAGSRCRWTFPAARSAATLTSATGDRK